MGERIIVVLFTTQAFGKRLNALIYKHHYLNLILVQVITCSKMIRFALLHFIRRNSFAHIVSTDAIKLFMNFWLTPNLLLIAVVQKLMDRCKAKRLLSVPLGQKVEG